MKNKQFSKKLSLNKLTISKLSNPSSIQGGAKNLLGTTVQTGMTSSCEPTGCTVEPTMDC